MLTKTQINQNAAIAMEFFISQGWDAIQSAGIVGNLIAESNLDPQAFNEPEQALGIAQWRETRQEDFYQVMRIEVYEAPLSTQLEFVQWELDNTHRTAYSMLKSAKTILDATYAIDKYYERSAGLHLDRRVNYATEQYDLYQQRIVQDKLDNEIEDSMDASDPPSVVQPGDTGEPVPSSTEPPAGCLFGSILSRFKGE